MAATVLAFPMERALAARPVLVAHNPQLAAERDVLAAEMVADIRVTVAEEVLPILTTAHTALSVMRHALAELDRRHGLARSLLTEAEALGEVIAALQHIADPNGENPNTPPMGAA
jgi:hypothetical protein